MALNDLIRYGAIAAGGYLLYKYMTGGSLDLTALFGGVVGKGQTASTTPGVSTITAAAQQATKTMMLQWAAGDSTTAKVNGVIVATMEQWNWIYNHIRGVQPKITNPYPTGYKMDIDQWWALAAATGLAGLPAVNYAFLRGR